MPEFLDPPRPSSFHRLNPLTKVLLATITAIDAVLLGGLVGPSVLIVLAVVLPALRAGVAVRLVRTTLLLSLPIGISVVVVNVFFFPGGQDVWLRVGPFTATREGLAFAVETLLRIAAISGAITLFYLTTRPSDLVMDLERRGVSARLGFVVGASVRLAPDLLQRARHVATAQRARGLETDGGIRARLRGVVPLVGPVLLGALAEVEERTLALESRGFGRPGRRTLLWAPADSGAQRLARWLLVLTIPMLVALRSAGLLGGLD